MRRALVVISALVLAGCSNISSFTGSKDKPAPALKLVSYVDCNELLTKLREAGKRSVGPWGFTIGGPMPAVTAPSNGGVPGAFKDSTESRAKAPEQGGDYSGTNVHEQGVDEPDMVKTDGKRIVILSHQTLYVIDAASKKVTWRLRFDWQPQTLLLHGDRVLAVGYERFTPVAEPGDSPTLPRPNRQRTHAELIDIREEPKVISTYGIDGSFVDARQVAGVVRLVTRNAPTIAFPQPQVKSPTNADRTTENRATIDKAPIDAWLPSITVDGKQSRVDCSDLNLPEIYSGASLVTLASFDLRAGKLSDGDPITVAADGNTVYGSGPNLYLAHDQRWRAWTMAPDAGFDQAKSRTDLLQFDITTPKPTYVAAGSVQGWLLNQYSLSEHDGVLRAAVTLSPPWRSNEKSSSTVYMLQRDGGAFREIGAVSGLGKGERIYAVRFVGKVGYVVTFRQTDPLYTLDLSNPKAPKVVGELKIPGYSAYLHPVSDSRLVGVGQDANDQGRVSGTQISLFDVGNLADPRRLDQYKISGTSSEAERDPHAFLHWPATKLLVVPISGREGALLLRVDGDKLTRLGNVGTDRQTEGQVRRNLVIGDVLWTVATQAVMASTLDGSRRLATLTLNGA